MYGEISMKGFLVVYKVDNQKDMAKLNHAILGRVIRIPRMGKILSYYSPGLLDDLFHYRVKDGCYFIKDDDEKFSRQLFVDGLTGFALIITVDLDIKDEDLITAREKWSTSYANEYVKNL